MAFAPPGAAGFRKKDGGGAAHARSRGGGGARMGCRKRCDPLQRLGEFVVAAPDIGAILSAAIPRLINGELMGHSSTAITSCDASSKYPVTNSGFVLTCSRARLR